jgi:predicted  nucleic acid-binding Zn-ribbon protein
MKSPQPLNDSIASRLYEQPVPESWQSFRQQQQQAGEGEGAGGSGGGSGDAGGAGGGGGDSSGASGGDSGGDDILTFEAPDPEAIAAEISGKGQKQQTPPPKTPPAKPPVTPPTKPPTGKEEPVAQLRNSYEALKKEHEELKKTYAAGDPRLKTIESERDAAKKELDEAKRRNEEFETKLALSNPAVVKELKDLDDGYHKEAERFYRGVPEIDHGTVSQLVKEYTGLPFNKPEYLEARAKFEAKVNEALGGDENNFSRRLEKTLEWIEKSAEFSHERPKIVAKVQGNARKLQVEAETKGFGERKTHVSGLIQKALSVPEGMEKTDPHHPQVVLKRFDEGLTPEQVSQFDKGIVEFVELAVNGVPPRTEADYAGLNQQQIAERQQAESTRVQAAKDHLVNISVNGLRALRRLPTLYAMLAKYKELAGQRREGAPPDHGSGDNGDGSGDDLRDFKPPEIPADIR